MIWLTEENGTEVGGGFKSYAGCEVTAAKKIFLAYDLADLNLVIIRVVLLEGCVKITVRSCLISQ